MWILVSEGVGYHNQSKHFLYTPNPGPPQILPDYLVFFQILQSDNGKVVGANDTSFQCDGSNSTFRVMFKEPVEILPNTSYTACATLKVKLGCQVELFTSHIVRKPVQGPKLG